MRLLRVCSLTAVIAPTIWVTASLTAHGQTTAAAQTQPSAQPTAQAQAQAPTPAAKSTSAAPVVVELFTSEGCSSCPPADDVLTMLVKSQPVAGAQIIALGEHVDYWDRLGWRDQFSSAQFTARQNEYARALHADTVYTPQLIVNGEQEVVGSDARKVKQAIAKAVQRQPAVTLALTFPNELAPDHATKLPVHVQANVAAGAKLPGPTEVLLAVTEDNLGSHVLKGENSGRDLHHGTVLRMLGPIGTFGTSDASFSATGTVSIEKNWDPRQVHIVALAQAQDSRRIIGAAIAPLPAPSQTPTK